MRSAISINRFDSVNDKGDRSAQAGTQTIISQIERQRGNLAAALAHAKESVAIEESLAAAISAPARRAGFLGHRIYIE